MFYMIELIRRYSDRLEIHASGVGNAMFALAMGGNGFQGMEGNIAPKMIASVINGFVNKDMALMHSSFRQLMLLHALLKGPATENQRAIKPVLNTYGLNGGTIRPPRIAIEGAELERMLDAIEALKIPEMAGWTRKK
jgi:dihydrodipicolinate synthase/N-acetylneuraminate lyase